MANFAKIDPTTNRVINVVMASHEAVYGGFLGDSNHFIEYNLDGTLRNEAIIGGYYLPSVELFTNEKEGESWTFNSSTNQYDPPNPEPTLTAEQVSNNLKYIWNEDNYRAGESGWILIKKNTPEN
jgi:hypothetical protein